MINNKQLQKGSTRVLCPADDVNMTDSGTSVAQMQPIIQVLRGLPVFLRHCYKFLASRCKINRIYLGIVSVAACAQSTSHALFALRFCSYLHLLKSFNPKNSRLLKY